MANLGINDAHWKELVPILTQHILPTPPGGGHAERFTLLAVEPDLFAERLLVHGGYQKNEFGDWLAAFEPDPLLVTAMAISPLGVVEMTGLVLGDEPEQGEDYLLKVLSLLPNEAPAVNFASASMSDLMRAEAASPICAVIALLPRLKCLSSALASLTEFAKKTEHNRCLALLGVAIVADSFDHDELFLWVAGLAHSESKAVARAVELVAAYALTFSGFAGKWEEVKRWGCLLGGTPG